MTRGSTLSSQRLLQSRCPRTSHAPLVVRPGSGQRNHAHRNVRVYQVTGLMSVSLTRSTKIFIHGLQLGAYCLAMLPLTVTRHKAGGGSVLGHRSV